MLPCAVIKPSASFKWLEYYKDSYFQFGERRNVRLRTCPLNYKQEGSSQKHIHVRIEKFAHMAVVFVFSLSRYILYHQYHM
jgi:predicted RNase H-like nuclease